MLRNYTGPEERVLEILEKDENIAFYSELNGDKSLEIYGKKKDWNEKCQESSLEGIYVEPFK